MDAAYPKLWPAMEAQLCSLKNLSRSVKTKDFRSDRKDTRMKQEVECQGTPPAPEGAKHWFVFVIRKMCDTPQTNKKGKQARYGSLG
jgi:hypothetical protein